jgi:hypothetical protein
MSFDVREWVASNTGTDRRSLRPSTDTAPGATRYDGADGERIAVVHETRERVRDTGPGPGPRTVLTIRALGMDDVEIVLPVDVQLVR